MTELSAMLGTNLFYRLEKLRQEKGMVTAEDAGHIVEHLMKSGNHRLFQKEIVQMIADIENAKSEILSLSNGPQTNKRALSDASEHLDTIVKSTEEAANSFMDVAASLSQLAERRGGKDEEELREICMRIYESCNFQDLTSQRIAKVIKLLRSLEAHILKLTELFEVSTDGVPEKSLSGDAALLNGPALPSDAVSQDDIDALFKSLGG